jgi:hypothetical protein
MKALLTAIIISIGFVVASIGGSTNQPSDIGSVMSTRTYKITPDTFFSSLKHQVVPKDGESDIKLLRRFFQEHHIDFTNPKTALFLNDKKGILYVRVTPADQDRVEHCISEIINSK